MNQKQLSGKILAAPVAIVSLVILIAIGAYLAYAIYQSKQIEQVRTPIAIAEPSDNSDSSNTSVPSDEIVDWQTYRNDQYGFEFRYPKEWFLTDYKTLLKDDYSPQDSRIFALINKKIDGMCQPSGSISVGLNINKDGKTTKELADLKKQTKPVEDGDLFDEYLFSEDIYRITGIEAIRIHLSPKPQTKTYECQLQEGDWIYFLKNKQVYELNTFTEPKDWNASKEKIYQILATFKFTD